MVRFRHHRGALVESMRTAVEFGDLNGLLQILQMQHGWFEIKPRDVTVELYCESRDERIDWDQTWLVKVKGEPVGFTDGEVPGC